MEYKLVRFDFHHSSANITINSIDMDEFNSACNCFFIQNCNDDDILNLLAYFFSIKEFPQTASSKLNEMLLFLYNQQPQNCLKVSVLHLFVLRIKLYDPKLYEYLYSKIIEFNLIDSLFTYQYPPNDFGFNHCDLHISIFINCMIFNKNIANSIFEKVFPFVLESSNRIDPVRILKFIMAAPSIPCMHLPKVKEYINKCKGKVSLKDYLEANLNLIKKIPINDNFISYALLDYYKLIIKATPEKPELSIIFQTLSYICKNRPKQFLLNIDFETFETILSIVKNNKDVAKNALIFISIWMFKCLGHLSLENRIFLYLNFADIFQSLSSIRPTAIFENQVLISSILILFLANLPPNWINSKFEIMAPSLANSFFIYIQYSYGEYESNSEHLFEEQFFLTQLNNFLSNQYIKGKPEILKNAGFNILDQPRSNLDEVNESIKQFSMDGIQLYICDSIYVYYET